MSDNDKYNVEVRAYHHKQFGTWEPRDFIVLHQPEPWSLSLLNAAVNCALHLQHPPRPPPSTFVWPHEPRLKLRITVIED